MNSLEKVGERLKYERIKNNLALENLAQKINLTKDMLNNIENGKVDFEFTILCDLANALNIDIKMLLLEVE